MAPNETTTTDATPVDYNAGGRSIMYRPTAVRLDSNEFELTLQTRDPRSDERTLECDTETKSINQYIYVERSGRSRSGSASSLNHHDRLLVVVRDGDEWTAYSPRVKPPKPRRDDSKYRPTQVPGVSEHTVRQQDGGRGHESRYLKRYKIGRELVEQHDDARLVEFRHEQGSSRNCSYNRLKNATATKLTTEH